MVAGRIYHLKKSAWTSVAFLAHKVLPNPGMMQIMHAFFEGKGENIRIAWMGRAASELNFCYFLLESRQ
jgi:hypothetical protein